MNQPRDLIGDIQAKQRRKIFRRAAVLVTLALILLGIGIAFKKVTEHRDAVFQLEAAQETFVMGTWSDVDASIQSLNTALERHAGHAGLTGALAVATGFAAAEFDGEVETATQALEAAKSAGASELDLALAQALVDLAKDDLNAAKSSVKPVLEAQAQGAAADDIACFAPRLAFAVDAKVALASGDSTTLGEARGRINAALSEHPEDVTLRRALVYLAMAQGEGSLALDELARSRKQSQLHTGLAADEALFNAMQRQRLGGVASVADQLVSRVDTLTRVDLAHARLAQAVVRLHEGELTDATTLLEDVWPKLPSWDRQSRVLALEIAVQAGALERVREWLPNAGLSEEARALFDVWLVLEEGDVMGALATLATMPQADARVAYLQGLALVEQGRWPEAKPWLERADRLMPGRVEIEIALARCELRLGDREAAARKLEGLAEDDFAPRALTGRGEAMLAELDAAKDKPGSKKSLVTAARKALESAIKDEPRAAQARLLLAELMLRPDEGGKVDYVRAQRLMEDAVATNPKLPIYRESLAHLLIDLSFLEAAAEQYAMLDGALGIDPKTPLESARVSILLATAADTKPDAAEIDRLLAKAQELGAPPALIELERHRLKLSVGARAEIEATYAALAALLEQSPDATEERLLYIDALTRLGDLELAVGAIRRGLSLAGDKGETGRLYRLWARAEGRAGKAKRASTLARTAFAKMRDEHRPPVDLLKAAEDAVRFAIRERKPKPVLPTVKQLTDILDFHPAAWVIRAEAELGTGLTQEARISVERSIKLDDRLLSAHELHANVLLRFGLKDQAHEAQAKAEAIRQARRDGKPMTPGASRETAGEPGSEKGDGKKHEPANDKQEEPGDGAKDPGGDAPKTPEPNPPSP